VRSSLGCPITIRRAGLGRSLCPPPGRRGPADVRPGETKIGGSCCVPYCEVGLPVFRSCRARHVGSATTNHRVADGHFGIVMTTTQQVVKREGKESSSGSAVTRLPGSRAAALPRTAATPPPRIVAPCGRVSWPPFRRLPTRPQVLIAASRPERAPPFVTPLLACSERFQAVVSSFAGPGALLGFGRRVRVAGGAGRSLLLFLSHLRFHSILCLLVVEPHGGRSRYFCKYGYAVTRVYSRKLCGAPSYVGRHCAPEQACSIHDLELSSRSRSRSSCDHTIV